MKLMKIIFLTTFFVVIGLCANAQQDSLQTYRKSIDSLDLQLIQLLGKRMEVVTAIGKYKIVHHIAPLQPKRFQEIVEKNILLGRKEQLSETFIRALMDAIHEESLKKEKAL